tara:strand:+ start:265 stop:618 length:354 start_codon:yes stop_codon:yes gene_type:complete
MAFKLKNKQIKKIIGELRGASKLHAGQADKLEKIIDSPMEKRMGDFKHSDAPDAKGKFAELSAEKLANWLIKSRNGNLSRIIASLNQQIVFRRNKNPKYAAKMRKTQDIVRRKLKKS